MISVAQAQRKIIDAVMPVEETRVRALAAACGRVLAEDIVSTVSVPAVDNSAMDGFAVNSADVQVVPLNLPISQRIPAGAKPLPLETNSIARIFTGAMMPAGADAVIIQENCDFQVGGSSAQLNKVVRSGDNVRPLGQDIRLGATVAQTGNKLNAANLALIASVGIAQVSVFRKLRVAVFSTGDELIEPGQALADGQVYNSNRTMLAVLCHQLGHKVIDCGIVEDTLDATKKAMQSAALHADVIISSGGVSVGEEDHIKPAIEALGTLDLWKVQMKPGKPVAFGQVNGTPFLGLPGNPVSSFVVFQLLAQPLLAARQGQQWAAPTAYPILTGFSKKISDREEYIRVKLQTNDSGHLVAKRFDNQSSGVMSSLSWADGLLRQDTGAPIVEGQSAPFIPLREGLL